MVRNMWPTTPIVSLREYRIMTCTCLPRASTGIYTEFLARTEPRSMAYTGYALPSGRLQPSASAWWVILITGMAVAMPCRYWVVAVSGNYSSPDWVSDNPTSTRSAPVRMGVFYLKQTLTGNTLNNVQPLPHACRHSNPTHGRTLAGCNSGMTQTGKKIPSPSTKSTSAPGNGTSTVIF